MDVNEANKILLSKDNVTIVLWELSELENSEPENIESNDLEIMGEDEQGMDGYCTVQITEVAGRAVALIQALLIANSIKGDV